MFSLYVSIITSVWALMNTHHSGAWRGNVLRRNHFFRPWFLRVFTSTVKRGAPATGFSEMRWWVRTVLIYLLNDPTFSYSIFWNTLKFEAFFRNVIARYVKLQSSIHFLRCKFLLVVITLCKKQNINTHRDDKELFYKLLRSLQLYRTFAQTSCEIFW